YTRYLRGRHAYNQGSPDGWRRAAKAFEDSVALDPGYAPAWAMLALATTLVASEIGGTSAEVVQEYGRAWAAADKAVALAPDLTDGYVARALIRSRAKWDWSGAATDLERALKLSPSDARALRNYANHVLQPLGRIPEAIATARTATELDPLSPYSWGILGMALCFHGEMDAARNALIRSLELAPELYRNVFWLATLDL